MVGEKKRQTHKLSPAAVRHATKPGLYGDGAGLWLSVNPGGGKSWLFRFMRHGKSREMGLGPLHTIGLAEARERAQAARKLLLDHVDPLAERDEKRQKAKEATAARITFKMAAERYIAKESGKWKSDKHRAQWTSSLAQYVYPVIGDMDVAAIGIADVERVLSPVWTGKVETANRLRSRMELILDFATASEMRSGDNPAGRKGALQHRLPGRQKVEQRHHAALPYKMLPSFVAALRQHGGIAARAVEFLILTAGRSGEVRGATWQEIDLEAKTWTVPPGRMKGNREHVVPLSDAAIVLLETMPRDGAGLIFPGGNEGAELSDVALSKIAKLSARGVELTLHGFRSSFRDWCGDETDTPREIAEAALAHSAGDKVEQAYRRGTALKKRAELMQAWANWCDGKTSQRADNVVSMRAVSA